METERQKQLGAYYTPDDVVRSLVRWVVVAPNDRMLDPSCGDGRFLTVHPHSVGVEEDPLAAAVVHERVPGSLIHQGDFFTWAANTHERFECAAGNPPFIRYQRFNGAVRNAALSICKKHGATFSSLSSSWAPFLVATASLLKPGGRMAFVVPAEIGHAPYALPLLQYLIRNFANVQIIAVQKKLFRDLSEDCWLLYCSGFGNVAKSILLSGIEEFRQMNSPPQAGRRINISELESWGGRLRQFLLPSSTLEHYRCLSNSAETYRLADVARVGIGYVTGANDFFHLRPSEAESLRIPRDFLWPAVRNGRDLIGKSISKTTVKKWELQDEAHFLLRLQKSDKIPPAIKRYLESTKAKQVQNAYKCRNRAPWYVVPDVQIPDGFLSYMSGETPSLVANRAGCVATNSVHVVRLRRGTSFSSLQCCWSDPLTTLSCEIEGHPLGGGMLKLEPREASRILLRRESPSNVDGKMLQEGVEVMRRWRHYG
jgi:adenine-specific DNA-methyltransferase